MNYIDQIMYDAGGHTGNEYYVRKIHNKTGKIWNPDDKVLEDVGDITWEESVDDLVEEELTGVFPIVIQHDSRTRDDISLADYGKAYANLTPEHIAYADLTDPEKAVVDAQEAQKTAVNDKFDLIKNLPAGIYDVVVYKKLGSLPQNDDDVQKQYVLKHGSIFGF